MSKIDLKILLILAVIASQWLNIITRQNKHSGYKI